MNDKPHLDVEALAELQDVMENEFEVLIQTYLADSRSRIESLDAALQAESAEQFAKAAHSFKGSCINIGAPRLGGLCFEAEQLGKDGDLAQGRVMLDAIQAEFQEVAQRLQNFDQEE
ncbi:Hpt domain-containing protein [Marinobacter sp. VGCF2001]|uniref:Hpt domain-containing protein n=1 Tax=Marinobacter sp. VGCF2001 TaxID=3417189 RepID=UPI003CED160E